MEDFSTILIIVLAAVSGIFSFINGNNKKKQAKKTVRPEDVMDEVFGEEPEVKPVQEETVRVAAPVYSPVEVPVSGEPKTPEAHQAVSASGKKKFKVDPVKMILYSEILRPKYLEGNETK